MASISVPTAIMIAGAATATAGVAGTVMSSNAATSAAQTQATSAKNALDLQSQMFNIGQNNLRPYMTAGQNGLMALSRLTGVGGSNDAQIQQLQQELQTLGAPSTPGGAQAGGVANPNQPRIDEINQQLQSLQASNAGGNPLTAPLTAPFNPTQQQLEQTPGYQFTLSQGLRATQNAMTSQGLGSSGPAVADAAKYATGLATQTYQNQFNNYWQQNQNIYDMLSKFTTMGQNSAAGVGVNAINAGNAMSGNITGAGNALAAGQIGSANAIAGGVNNVASSLGNSAQLYALSQNGLFGSGGNPPMATYGGGGSWNPAPGGFPEDTAVGY